MLSESDEEQLKLLSIFHYVLAGLTAFAGLLPLLYVLIGAWALANSIQDGAPWFGYSAAKSPLSTGIMIMAFGFVLATVIFALAFLKFLVARFLVRHYNYTFCLVFAVVELLFLPLGTILGIFTLLVLSRPHVKAVFTPKGLIP